MRTIIAGSRDCTDYSIVCKAVEESGFTISEVVSGGCKGVDTLGELWAREHKVPTRVFDAEWQVLGRAAGPIRNRQMADYADALVAIWDGDSRGTKNMIDEATKRGLKVHVHRFDPVPESFRKGMKQAEEGNLRDFPE